MSLTRTLVLAGLLASGGSLLHPSAARAQAPGWQTAMALATNPANTAGVFYTATDASGNLFVAGAFTGTLTLGSTTLSNAGARVPFVAKWNTATSTWIWAQQLSSAIDTYSGGLAVVGNSLYLSGSFRGTLTAGSATLSSPTNYDVFVAKLTDTGTAGTWVWAQQAGGSGNDYAYALAAQGSSVYVTGEGYSPSLTFGTATYPTPNMNGTFVAKLTDSGASGSYTWALIPTGSGFGLLQALAVQNTSVYAAGVLQGTENFGGTTLSTSSINDADVLLTKITDAGTTGSWTWAQRAGGSSTDSGVALAVSGTAVYLAGDFYSTTATFGPTTLTSAGNIDVFVTKLTDAGATSTWNWAQRAGGPADDQTSTLAVRGSSVYVAANVANSTTTFGSTSLVCPGSPTAVVARLADAGPTAAWAWAQAVGTTTYSSISALTISGTQVYAGGFALGSSTFGSQTLASNTGTQYGFLATLADAAALHTTAPVAQAGALGLFPNPAHGTTTVQLPAGLAAGPATLTVLDNLGRVVRTRSTLLVAGTATIPLDVAGLAPGVYALRVAAGEQLGTARLVVE